MSRLKLARISVASLIHIHDAQARTDSHSPLAAKLAEY